jgi:hypothetical protein
MARDRAAKSAYDKAAKAWYAEHKSEKQAYDVARRPIKNALRRADYVVDPEKYLVDQRGPARRAKNLRSYGLTPESFDLRFASQGNRCACCHSSTPRGNKTWCVDHDHMSGEVRGIICGLCNTGIGHLGDTLADVESAENYLRRHLGLSISLVDEHY